MAEFFTDQSQQFTPSHNQVRVHWTKTMWMIIQKDPSYNIWLFKKGLS